jgi:hypothetical protein
VLRLVRYGATNPTPFKRKEIRVMEYTDEQIRDMLRCAFLDGKIQALEERSAEIAKEIEIKKQKIERLQNEPSS